MASPQLEHGHTRIANELLEQLALVPMSGVCLRVVLYVIRVTYGYGRKDAPMSIVDIATNTSSTRSYVSEALNWLEGSKIITRNGRNIGIQKDWEQWKSVRKCGRKRPQTPTKTSVNTGENVRKCERFDDDTVRKNRHLASANADGKRPQTPTLPSANTDVFEPAKENIKEKRKKKDSLLSVSEKSVDEIFQDLSGDYPGVNIKHELAKFKEWWDWNGPLKRPRAAAINWLDKAKRDIATRSYGGTRLPTHRGGNGMPTEDERMQRARELGIKTPE